ncbi:MAG: hypothetical protein [Bacteriophage sp.]|nr:MAG: hypothetical protein [Bacteriophage sp.]
MTDKTHNSKLTDDEEKALLFHHARKEIEIKAKIEELQKERKLQRKKAQADGIKSSKLDKTVKIISSHDKQTIVDDVLGDCKLLYFFGLANYQDDLFAVKLTGLDLITKEGELAGWQGENGKSPYLAGSEEDSAWLTGWQNGQATLAEKFLTAREKLDTNTNVDIDNDPFTYDDVSVVNSPLNDVEQESLADAGI